MKTTKTNVARTEHYGLQEATSVLWRNKLLIDRLEHYPEIESIMDGLEKIANKEGVPLTTILKVIWALETM